MSNVCILTDSTAMFSRAAPAGSVPVRVISFGLGGATGPALQPPAVEDFVREYGVLGEEYEAILVTVVASALNPLAAIAAQAAGLYGGPASVTVIDSQNTGAGLGLLVELAADCAAGGEPAREVERLLRSAIPHVYTLLCIPALDNLARAGYLTKAQAVVGEMMGMLPIFVLEEGHLSPLEKVRTQRHLIESCQEFMEEFASPRHIALMKGAQNRLRTKPLRLYVNELFPDTPFTELPLNPTLTALFGPQALGLTVMELD